eukprot:3357904-Pyramimonas_sp.AAC.1
MQNPEGCVGILLNGLGDCRHPRESSTLGIRIWRVLVVILQLSWRLEIAQAGNPVWFDSKRSDMFPARGQPVRQQDLSDWFDADMATSVSTQNHTSPSCILFYILTA